MGNLRNKLDDDEWRALENSSDENKVTRLEIINHADNKRPVGRLLTLYKELGDFNRVELDYQDHGRTLKIFLL
jgi:hypothetical protein